MTNKKVTTEKTKTKRVLSGVVVSTAMDKTIVVNVERTYKHPVVGKVVRTLKKYKVHDENNSSQVGDLVEIVECRPLSKTKHMMLQRIISQAPQPAVGE